MTEHPIPFNGPMVRALLEGRKTVTRRLVKGNQIPKEDLTEDDPALRWSAVGQNHPRWGYVVSGATEVECAEQLSKRGICPYGRPGDRLWVRETTEADYDTHDAVVLSRYSADKKPVLISEHSDQAFNGSVAHWNYRRDTRPSIHMPRRDCRILLEITSVRIERLQSISEEQAAAEGILPNEHCIGPIGTRSESIRCRHCGKLRGDHVGVAMACFGGNGTCWNGNTARGGFAWLWESINGPGSWAANPWVWAIDFKVVSSAF